MKSSENERSDSKNISSERQTCRDFLRGVCQRGQKCRFYHPVQSIPSCTGYIPICRDFQNGLCSRKFCKYAHIEKSPQKTAGANKQTTNNVVGMEEITQTKKCHRTSKNDHVHCLPHYDGYQQYLTSLNATGFVDANNMTYYHSYGNKQDCCNYFLNLPQAATGWNDCQSVLMHSSTYPVTQQVSQNSELKRLQHENQVLREQNHHLTNKLYQCELLLKCYRMVQQENSDPHERNSGHLRFSPPDAASGCTLESAFSFGKNSTTATPTHMPLSSNQLHYLNPSGSSNCSSSFDYDDRAAVNTPENLYCAGVGSTNCSVLEPFEVLKSTEDQLDFNSEDHETLVGLPSDLVTMFYNQPCYLNESSDTSGLSKSKFEDDSANADDDISEMIKPTIDEFLNVTHI